jgi:hypothetical protein
MHGLKTKRRKKTPDLALSAESQISKMSCYYVMHAMHHTIPTVLVYLEFQMGTGFAWNVRTKEHTPGLQNIRNPYHNEGLFLDGLPQEHKKACVAIGNA